MMASLSSSSPGKPLRLKDFLRDDPNSDSCGGARGGFRITTTPGRQPDKTVRYLLAMELRDASAGDRTLKKCRSNKGPLSTKLTAVINTVKMLPFSASPSAAGCGHSCATPFPKQGGGGGGGGFLPRSFSRKLRRSFWRKRDKVEHRVESSTAVRSTIVRVKDIVRLRSFGDERRGFEPPTEMAAPRSPPSPVRSAHSRTTSSSSGGGAGAGAVGGPWSDTDSAGSDSFSCGSSVFGGELKESSPDADANHCASPSSPYMARGVGGDSISKSTSHREPKTKEEEKVGGAKGMVDCPRHFEEEKDQLSPVSVMDFPFEEDDDDTVGGDVDAARVAASPTAFRRSLADIERTKHQLLQKIREFENLAALVDPVDLESRFESSEDENEADDDVAADGQLLQFQLEVEERALALLRDVKLQGGAPVKMAAADELLVDFFIERLTCPPHDDGGGVRSRMKRRPDRAEEEAAEEEEALLRAAEDWFAGRRRGEAAKGWEAEVMETETDGRWRRCHVDEEEIAGDLGDCVLDALVDELLADLF